MYKKPSCLINSLNIPRKFLLLIVLIIPTYSILIFLGDVGSFRNGLVNFKWLNLVISILIIFSSQIIRSLRWHFWLKKIVKEITLKDNILFYISGLALMATPGRLGEAIRSLFIRRDYGVALSKTIPVVFIERFYELVTIGVFSSVTIFFVNFNKIIVIIPAILTISVIIIVNKKEIMLFLLNKLSKRRFFSKILPNLEDSTDTIYRLVHYNQLIPSIAISLLAGLLDMIGIYFLVLGLDIKISFPESVLIISSALLAGFLSLIPGGFVAIEGSIVGLLTLKGISYSDSVIFLFLYRIVSTIFISLLGIAAFQYVTKNRKNNML